MTTSIVPPTCTSKYSSRIRLSTPDTSDNLAEGSAAANQTKPIPLHLKVVAICLISIISCSWQWSLGVSRALKSTIKEEMNISNTEFSLLEGSEDFMTTVLIIPSGILADRVGGSVSLVYGQTVFMIGAILLATATTIRSYDFMIAGKIILSVGQIFSEISQCKMFSAWFAPGKGFAVTLGIESALGKVGGFVGIATANIIAEKYGFEWSFWVAAFISIFGNAVTLLFWLLDRYCARRYDAPMDDANGDNLRMSKEKFNFQKIFQFPWMLWAIFGFSTFESAASEVFSQNATELAQKRFNVDPVPAGWYSAVSEYGGLVLCPLLGIFLDRYGKRVFAMLFLASFLLLGMLLLNFALSKAGTALSFAVYGIVKGTTSTIMVDSIRTIIWEEAVFGTACAFRLTSHDAMGIIIRLVTGVLQDLDNDSYHRVNYVYLGLAVVSMVIALAILVAALWGNDFGPLQWSRKRRFTDGPRLLAELRDHHFVRNYRRTRHISIGCFSAMLALILASWGVYIWGAVTGHNYD
ncbi:putative MFS transporter [Aspergillus ambiguus]|uniref:MFS transporter n=1 Tax=Aspergillus ambiguus TaxID=176160 RepID=UPI003CCCEA99